MGGIVFIPYHDPRAPSGINGIDLKVLMHLYLKTLKILAAMLVCKKLTKDQFALSS